MVTLGNVYFPWEWEPWSKEMLCGHQEEPQVILHLSPFLVFKHKCLSCTQGNSSVAPCVPIAYIGVLKAKDADLPVNNEWDNHTVLLMWIHFCFQKRKSCAKTHPGLWMLLWPLSSPWIDQIQPALFLRPDQLSVWGWGGDETYRQVVISRVLGRVLCHM